MDREYKYLTREQVEHFMQHGYLRLSGAFTPEKAHSFAKDIWVRLGYDPDDKSTWERERINMPSHTQENVQTFAPKAWGAICELLGGEERVNPENAVWKDSMIVNLGTPEWEGKWPHPSDLDNWHVDGDFFMHFLDSPEQALLVIPVFSDEIVEHGGGTMVCPDGIEHIARHLHDHPDGVSPHMVPRGQTAQFEGLGFYSNIVKQCDTFHEMTGKKGDVILLHPLMLHSASRNSLRIPRFITNPPVSLREPFNFNRSDPREYSVVELKTLKALGTDSLPDWKATGSRDHLVPERVKVQQKMKEMELERLRKMESPEVAPQLAA